MNFKLKINSPQNLEQKELIEIYTSNDLELDYSNCDFLAVDTEFLSLNTSNDKLCVIQISSILNEQKRVEIISVFNSKPSEKLIELFTNNNIKKIFHYAKADLPRIEGFLGTKVNGEIFDTYIGAMIVLTNIYDYSLEGLIQYLIDPKFQKAKKLSSSQWDLPIDRWSEDQIEYCAKDVVYLDTLMTKLQEVSKRRGSFELMEKTMSILRTTIELDKKGYDLTRLF